MTEAQIAMGSIRKSLQNFRQRYESLLPNKPTDENGFYQEFLKLQEDYMQWRTDSGVSSFESSRDYLRRKNRYKDIVPYDDNRVKINNQPGVPGSDYINASYVKGASGHAAYIAAQGPLHNTVADFWRMLWEKNVHVIVMTCREEENGKSKCERYWPLMGETKSFNDIFVELENEELSFHKDFFTRNLKATFGDETRMIRQYHYISWPDHGVPESVTSMLDMVALIRDYQPGDSTPIVVHCSAGCGRTGTICAIDISWSMLRLGIIDVRFNLYDIVLAMRKQRVAMVQTREQYHIAYKAVNELFSSHLEIMNQHLYENVTLKVPQKQDDLPAEDEEASQEPATYEEVKLTDYDYVNTSVLEKMTSAMKNTINNTVQNLERNFNQSKEKDSVKKLRRPPVLPKPTSPDIKSNRFPEIPSSQPKQLPKQLSIESQPELNAVKKLTHKQITDEIAAKISPQKKTDNNNTEGSDVRESNFVERGNIYEDVSDIALAVPPKTFEKNPKIQMSKPPTPTKPNFERQVKEISEVKEERKSKTSPVAPPRQNRTASRGKASPTMEKESFDNNNEDLYSVVDKTKNPPSFTAQERESDDYSEYSLVDVAPDVPMKSKKSHTFVTSSELGFPKRLGIKLKGPRPIPPHWPRLKNSNH